VHRLAVSPGSTRVVLIKQLVVGVLEYWAQHYNQPLLNEETTMLIRSVRWLAWTFSVAYMVCNWYDCSELQQPASSAGRRRRRRRILRLIPLRSVFNHSSIDEETIVRRAAPQMPCSFSKVHRSAPELENSQ